MRRSRFAIRPASPDVQEAVGVLSDFSKLRLVVGTMKLSEVCMAEISGFSLGSPCGPDFMSRMKFEPGLRPSLASTISRVWHAT